MNSNLNFQEFFPNHHELVDKAQFLEKLTDEFPFFAAAPFFLLKVTGREDAILTEKAALHFHPIRLHHLLHSTPEAFVPSTIAQQDVATENESAVADDWENVFQGSETEDISNEMHTVHELLTDSEPVTIASSTEKLEEMTNQSVNIEIETKENTTLDVSQEVSQQEIDLNQEKNNEPVAEEVQEKKPFDKATTEEAILFEPLHTSDYFASQGIKLTEEKVPADRLGKQLKSFTEWLQTMKSLQAASKSVSASPALVASVQTLAERSNTEEEILTKSMAEAYILQGKKEKAIEIYEKLKLLNPSKSTSFAAEISRLQA